MPQVTTDVGTELLFENDRIKVWSMVLKPGEDSPRHRHVSDYVFIYATPSWMTFSLENDPPLTREFGDGFVQYADVGARGIEHQIRNDGTEVHRQLIIELKGPSRTGSPGTPQNNGRVGQPVG